MATVRIIRALLQFGVTLLCATFSGYAAEGPTRSSAHTPPRYALKADQYWQLNSPDGRSFEASGLVLLPDGNVLTESDKHTGIYRIELLNGTNAANLVRLPNCFTDDQLAPFAKEKIGAYDFEGITRDDEGRLYLCEEANRWILRFDPRTHTVERLTIDWSPVKKYFHPTNRNASFEGMAIGDGKLYVANEHQVGRIIVVDLATLKVESDFSVKPTGNQARDIHYSDLSWFDGSLFALLRESSCILKVDPATRKVLAEYSFSDMENQPEVLYKNKYPTSTMEGLAVDKDSFWLCTDNNGRPRVRYPNDTRPTLFKCPRPDRK